jgi:hypothetical protein
MSEFFTHSYSVFTYKANSKAGRSPPARVSHASAFFRDRGQTELAHPEPLGAPLPASLGALLRHAPYAGRIASVVDQLILWGRATKARPHAPGRITLPANDAS